MIKEKLTPFSKILIANRGEIALRIMRTARKLGHQTVAIYSVADKKNPHVAFADQAICVGEALPAESYLNIQAIIAAAKQTSAEAIHPGYGFLAENSAFALACREANIVFIGPSAEVIRAMGDKANAKEQMRRLGLPCIQGYDGEDQSMARLQSEAKKIGYPVMIKACLGGGGRGMRLVQAEANFSAALSSAKAESLSAFGSDSVLLEKAISNPRHIEIQIMADRYGHAIHLGERDCSVQRRHQKIIEEAPSPKVTPELRNAMGNAAVKAAVAMNYEGAGTFEFLLDDDDCFYFMEMNTRLQVEHPVTEAITGLDLVALQLDIASGAPLSIQQRDIRFDGHSIEVRLCAEDVAQNFLPQSGQMCEWQAPANLRVEHAMYSGVEVPPYYDSMIAKIISHAPTRDQAITQLLVGLQDLNAFGVSTNQGLLDQTLRHPIFKNGEATTSFIQRYSDELLKPFRPLNPAVVGIAFFVSKTFDGKTDQWQPSNLHHHFPVSLKFELNRKKITANIIQKTATTFLIDSSADEESSNIIEIISATSRCLTLLHEQVQSRVDIKRLGNRLYLQQGSNVYVADDCSFDPPQAISADLSRANCNASTTGRVIAVHVKNGDFVKSGQPIACLEAMKMEHIQIATMDGYISELCISNGEQLKMNQLICSVTADSPQ
jgi:geranyl-CoA carboxylase alpha subunit